MRTASPRLLLAAWLLALCQLASAATFTYSDPACQTPGYTLSGSIGSYRITCPGGTPLTLAGPICGGGALTSTVSGDTLFVSCVKDPGTSVLGTSSLPPSSIGTTSATLNGFASTGAYQADVGIEYGLTDSYGTGIVLDPIPAHTANRQINTTVTDLACGTTYHYRSAIYDGHGYVTGSDVSFSTLPCGGAAPVLVSAVSRKTHGSAGIFDLPLNLGVRTPSIEPRQSQKADLLLTFDKPLINAIVELGEGVATLGTPQIMGAVLVVPLTDVGDRQYVTVTVRDVVATSGGNTGSASVRVGFLAGDVNGSGSTSVSDLLAVNGSLAQALTAANFRYDVNVSGTLTLSDVLFVNSRLAGALPAP